MVPKELSPTTEDPCAKVDSFQGRTIVLLKSKPTGQGVFGKTSTLPKRLSESKEARRPGIDPLLSIDSRVDSSSRPSRPLSVEDTFTSRLDNAIEGTLDDFKALVLQAVADIDPATSQKYVHDRWLDFPTSYIRVHHEKHKTLYVPPDDSQSFALQDIEEARMTLIISENGATQWVHDNWHERGEIELDRTCVGATCFCKVDLNFGDDPVPAVDDTLAQKAKGVKSPGEPTELEVMEHNLTHLPFRSWCRICVQSKSKQNPSRTLKSRQPILHMDYSFIGDTPGEPQITCLNVVDTLSGLALSVVVPCKGRSVYAQAELRRFVLETGRTFGILQADSEPSLKQLAQTATGQVGGLSYRTSPTGWKQAQESVGNMQATLYAQIRTLLTDVKSRCDDVEISVHSSLYPWRLRHAQWLINKYLQKSDGLSAYGAGSITALSATSQKL